MEKKLGKYRIVREIGKGGMGVVYKGIDPTNEKPVAIKVLPPGMVDRSTVERFNREAQAMVRLKHPNIVGAYEFGMHEGKHFIVMEFVDGESLKTIMAHQSKFDLERCLSIVLQVGRALAYAHKEEGMAHRDIKPDNIIIQENGDVKVTDFGLVQIPGVTRVTMEGSAIGTAEYMSPEQVSDDAVDTRTDIYSLGVTMYEMLAGRPPFQADSLQVLMMKHKNEEPPPLKSLNPDVPVEIEMIVKKAMAKDVSQRYQRVQELVDDIRRFRGDVRQEPSAPEMAPSAKIQRPRSNYLTGRSLIIVFMGIVAAGGYFFKEEISGFGTKLAGHETQNEDLVTETGEYLEILERADEYYQQGLNYRDAGQAGKAIDYFNKAIHLRPDYPQYYKDLALAYELEGRNNKAIAAWLKVQETDVDGRYINEVQQRLNGL